MRIKQDAKVIYSDGKLETVVYDDCEICTQGLQPFLFVSDSGTLFVQYQMPEAPRGTRAHNFPYRVENYLSRDGGASWENFKIDADEQMDDPFVEEGMLQLKDGRIFTMDTYVQEVPGRLVTDAGKAGFLPMT